MDLGASDAAFNRMRRAISKLEYSPESAEFHPGNSVTKEYIIEGTYLRDVLLQSFPDKIGGAQEIRLQDPSDSNYARLEQLEHPSHFNNDVCGAFSKDMRIRSWAARYMRRDPVKIEGDPDLGEANESQIRAVATMIGERVSLIQGVSLHGHQKGPISFNAEIATWNRKIEDHH